MATAACASLCPFMRLAAKDAAVGAVLMRNVPALAAKCPHLAATGLAPQNLLAHMQTQHAENHVLPCSSLASPCTCKYAGLHNVCLWRRNGRKNR